MQQQEKKTKTLPTSTLIGVIALVFLITGYQTALFVHRAASLRIVANKDAPDTVYIVERVREAAPSDSLPRTERTITRKASAHAPAAQAVRRAYTPRRYESFRFNPNTVPVEDLMRLGFSRKQAEAIERYRQKGGRFHRKTDFAKSYVVADSVYDRLEPYIDIPLLDINAADSAAFEALPGIGPWFAARMVAYRRELHGYSYKEQLMDIYRFDREKFDGLSDLITVGPSASYPIWTLPADSLARHPYISWQAARGIVRFREHTPPEDCTLEALLAAGILEADNAAKLARCRVAERSAAGM